MVIRNSSRHHSNRSMKNIPPGVIGSAERSRRPSCGVVRANHPAGFIRDRPIETSTIAANGSKIDVTSRERLLRVNVRGK